MRVETSQCQKERRVSSRESTPLFENMKIASSDSSVSERQKLWMKYVMGGLARWVLKMGWRLSVTEQSV